MNYKIVHLSILFLCLLLFGCSSNARAISGMAKVTIKVIGEDNQPVEGVNVGVGFEYDGSMGSRQISKKGTSDTEGYFSASAKTNGYIGFRVTKSGYYKSTNSFDFEKLGSMHWKPWNPELTIILRKIRDPVPMYARNTRVSKIEIPVIGEKIGFDLVVFDWVSPYGSGVNSDFIFTLFKDYKSRREYDFNLKLEFVNDFDGIQKIYEEETGSVFILPRIAASEGYKKDLVSTKNWHPRQAPETTWDQKNHYFFRVRSEVENGEYKRSMHGKILGGISIGQKREGTAYIQFKYYLNPDYTRNLEFDPEQNLFRNLSDLEEVGIK